MAASLVGELMASGRWDVDLDWTPDVYEKLYDRTNKRAHLWHAMFFNADDDTLVCPPMPLRRIVLGGEKGITIGGPGPLSHLGIPGVGPAIRDREYVSGKDKLSNGSFDMLDADGTATYWRRVSQESDWEFEVGTARNPGGLDADDIIEPDIDQFPARPGDAYRLRLTDLIGTGQFRSRIVFDGRFDPPNLLTNGDFDDGPGGGWGTATYLEIVAAVFFGGHYALRVVPIPKPQLVTGPTFATGWTLGSTMSQHDDFLWIGETPKPQYIPHAGAGDFTVSPYVTYTNADPSKAIGASGYYRKVGPIGQYMPVTNHSFESGLTGWVQVAGAWSTSSATHVDGSHSATTGGIPGGALKSLQADAAPGGSVDPFTWAVGEEWRFDADICSGTKGTSDEADGEIHAVVYLVDAAYPLNDSHLELVSLRGDALDAAEWHHGQARYSVQADKVSFVPMATIYGHTAGSWYVDNFRATRIRGNNTGIYSAEFAAIPNQKYTFTTLFAISDAGIGGDITLRLIFSVAAGGIDVEHTTTLSQTGGQWKTLSVEGTCPKGYDTMRVAIDGDDITGGSFYVDADYTLLWKSDNNTDRSDGTPFAVVPSQRYAGGATIVRLAFIEKGSVRVGVVLSGPAVENEVVSVEHTFNEETEAAARVTFDITPKEGYDTATPFVLVKDLAGGDGTVDIVAVSNFTVEKSDNNSDSIAHDAIAVTPERSYKWTQKFASDENLQRGTIQLVAKCTRSGFPDQTFPSSAMAPALDESFQTLELDFTPPSGYASVVCSIVATDVEGSNIFIDKGELRDTDGTTVVFDATVTNPAGVTLDVNATAPTGTESVRCQLIAPSGTSGWIVGAAALSRTGVTPATGAAIVDDLLTHPRTHAPLSIAAGTVTWPEVIDADWHIVNMNCREALDHICNIAGREYRINPTDPPTIDVGMPDEVFTDHPDIVLLPEDIDVEELADPQSDVTERATEIVLLGNERTTAGGQRALIDAAADVPGGTEYDYNGHPVETTRFVSDGTVDHHTYAVARCADIARQEAEPPLVLTTKLSGKNTRPGLREGDWLRAYHPEAGVEDHTDDNAQVIEGRTVYPRTLRVLTMERVLGPSHYIKMRRHDGTFVQFRQPDGSDGPNLPGVRWSDEDAAALTIGDRLLDWQADPQGKAAGEQYLNWRRSRPR